MSWVSVGVAVVGGVASYASSKQQSKGARNSQQEQKSIPFSQQRKNAQAFALQQLKLQPYYASQVSNSHSQLATDNRAQQTQSASDMMRQLPEWAARERQITSKQRHGDLRDFQWMTEQSPSLQSMQKLGAQAGEQSPLLRLLNGDASGLLGTRSEITGQLEQQALGDLRLGSGLSEQEQRDAEQAARAGWASRGLAYSPGAVGAEILGRDAAGRQRLAERRNFAGGVQGMLQSEDESLRRYASGVEELNQRDLGNRSAVASNASAPLLASFAQRSGGTYNSLLGAYGTSLPISATSNILSQTPSVLQGAQALDPLYSYQADVANTNLNKSASEAAARQNMYGQIGGAAFSAAGSIYGQNLKNKAATPTTAAVPNGGAVAGYTYNPTTGYSPA